MADKIAFKKIRDDNVSRIIHAILRKGSLSRVEIAAECGIAPGTVTQLVGPLLEAGVVEEFKVGDSTGGRRPVYLRISPDYGCVATFEIRRDGVVSRVHDLQGALRSETRLFDKIQGGNSLFGAIAGVVGQIREGGTGHSANIVHLGLLCQDDIQDSELGVLYSTSLASDVIPLDMAIRSQLDVPVRKELIERFAIDYYLQKEAGEERIDYGYINIGDSVTASFTLNRKRVEIGGTATFDLTPFLSADVLATGISGRFKRRGPAQTAVDIALREDAKRRQSKIPAEDIARLIQSALVFFPVQMVYLGGKLVEGGDAARKVSEILHDKPRVRSWDMRQENIVGAFVEKLLERSANPIAGMT